MKSRITNFLNNNTEKIIIFTAILLSLLSLLYYYNNGLITSYGDSRAHLNIARRTVDSLTPGLAQLGGVWLPLLHVLMLPTIWNDFMWHSGLSGSIVNMPMYVIAVYYIYKLIFLVTKNKFSGLIGSIILGSNINLLYIQSTPMTEVLFVSTLVAGVYYLTLWAKTRNILHLITSAVFFFLTSFNRYEGWPVLFGAIAVVAIVSFFNKDKKKTEGRLIIFGSIAFLSIFLWLLWQTAIFHNPIYFLNSEFSAKSQTLIAINQGMIPQYKNLSVAIITFYYSLVHINGLIVLITTLTGILMLIIGAILKKNKLSPYLNLPLIILFIPGLFLIFALYNGNIPLSVPEVFANNKPGTYFNIRYALYSLPALAVFSSILLKNKIYKALILIVVLLNAYLLFGQGLNKIATIKDSQYNFLKEVSPTSRWIKENYKKGYILASAATADPIIFGTGLDIKRFITEGNGKYWEESMQNPSKYANFIILTYGDERDMVNKHVDHKELNSNFRLSQSFGVFRIYVKK